MVFKGFACTDRSRLDSDQVSAGAGWTETPWVRPLVGAGSADDRRTTRVKGSLAGYSELS